MQRRVGCDRGWWEAPATGTDMLWLACTVVPFGGLGYFGAAHLMAQQAIAGVDPSYWPALSVDDHIPFVAPFVWAYILYYPLLLLSLLVGLKSRLVLFRLGYAFVVVSLMAWATFVLWPSKMEQASLDTCRSLSCAMLGRIHDMDPGYNVFPSLHAAHTLIVLLFFLAVRSRLRWWVGGVSLCIIASTVLIKQHYIIDVPVGLLYGAIATLIAWVTAWPLLERLKRVRTLAIRPWAGPAWGQHRDAGASILGGPSGRRRGWEAETSDGGKAAETSDGGKAAETSDGGKAAETSDGGKAAETSDGGKAAETSDGGKAAETSDGGKAAETSDGGKAAESGRKYAVSR